MSRSPVKRRSTASQTQPNLQTFDELLKGAQEFLIPTDLDHIDPQKIYRELLAFYGSDLGGFDCFDIGGWRPNENNLSDVVAALLDPKRVHCLGPEILRVLFEHLLDHPALTPIQRVRVGNVADAILEADGDFTVTRERIGTTSRADIEIWGHNFLLIIEHKVEHGRETFVNHKHQTFRLAQDFRIKAAKFGIQADHIVMMFLAPEGMRPQNSEFIPLSFEFLSRVLCEVAQREDTPVTRSILGFSEFYRRFS